MEDAKIVLLYLLSLPLDNSVLAVVEAAFCLVLIVDAAAAADCVFFLVAKAEAAAVPF